MQCLRLNTALWISVIFQLRSHADQCSCCQLPYNFPPEIKSTTNVVTGNIAQVFNICKNQSPHLPKLTRATNLGASGAGGRSRTPCLLPTAALSVHRLRRRVLAEPPQCGDLRQSCHRFHLLRRAQPCAVLSSVKASKV